MSFFKKIIKKNANEKAQNIPTMGPTGVSTMSTELQLKYAKGVQYNMKIIIRGDRNVGKSTLFHRLQGQKFKESYTPTPQIQVANIQWNYKATDDVVKVEIWDVVDEGKRKANDQLKLTHGGEDLSPCLDAKFVDVYKGAHGVIMVYDITKMWTWSYIEREIYSIPSNVPVIILANCRDMGEHRTVQFDTMSYFLSSLDRGTDAADVRFTESSMKNGFGLKYLHTFFSLPYLRLQRNTLLKQLDDNEREKSLLRQELDIMATSNEFDYDKCLERTVQFQHQSQMKSHTSGSSRESSPHNSPFPNRNLTTSISNPRAPVAQSLYIPPSSSNTNHIGTSLDEFSVAPNDDVSDFLNDTSVRNTSTTSQRPAVVGADSDSDSDQGNPMVAGFQDDLESYDEVTQPQRAVASANIVLSSDEEDAGENVEVGGGDNSDKSDSENLINKLTSLSFTNQTSPQSPAEINGQKKTADSVESSGTDDEQVRPPLLDDEDLSSAEETTPKMRSVNIGLKISEPAEKPKKKKKKKATGSEDAADGNKSTKKKSKKSSSQSKKRKVKTETKPVDPLEDFLNDGETNYETL